MWLVMRTWRADTRCASTGRTWCSAEPAQRLQLERLDPTQGARLRSWMTAHVMPAFAGRVLPVDWAVALQCAQLHVPD